MARQVHVGDQFQGHHVGRVVQVYWIDPNNPTRIAICDVKGERDDEIITADDLLKFWTLKQKR